MGPVLSTKCDYVIIQPTFTWKDKEKGLALLSWFVESSRKESGCLFYGATLSGDKIFFREGYKDGEAARIHIERIKDKLTEFMEYASNDSSEVHGPKKELDAIKDLTDAWNPTYFLFLDGSSYIYSSRLLGKQKKAFCSIQPTFTVLDRQKFLDELAPTLCRMTKGESLCLWYGWTMTEDGTKAFCREAYKNGKGVAKHLDNVGKVLGDALESGVLKLDKIEIHGPKEELEICKATADPLNPVYFETYGESFTSFFV